MAKSYADYLRENGASEEDVKALDHPTGRKIFETQQRALEASESARVKAENDRKATEQWYNEVANPEFTAMQNKSIAAEAEAAKYRSAIKSAKDRGLLDITKDLGISDDSVAPVTAHPTVTGIDTSKFVTNDTLLQLAEREGDAIAIAQDIAYQHQQLFPDRPLNFRELRKEAVSKRVSVEQLWMDKYQVSAAREARDRKADEARLAVAREEGAKAEREKWATQQNPDLRPAMPSTSPFTVRKTSGDVRGKQPWEAPSEHTLSDDRIRRVATKTMTQ